MQRLFDVIAGLASIISLAIVLHEKFGKRRRNRKENR